MGDNQLRAQIEQEWRLIAEHLSLKLRSRPDSPLLPAMSGDYRGRSVRITAFAHRKFLQKTRLYTIVYADMTDLGERHVYVFRKDANVPIEDRWGTGVMVGNPDFDEQYIVQSEPPELGNAVLDGPICTQVLRYSPRSFQITSGMVNMRCDAIERDPARLQAYLDLACDLAEAAEGTL